MTKKFFSLMLVALLSGCATNTYVSDHFVVKGGVADLGGGREAALLEICELKTQADKPQQDLLRRDPSKAECSSRKLDYGLGTSMFRDIAAGAVPVVLGAGIQAKAARSVASKTQNCKGVGCGESSNQTQTVNVNLPCTTCVPAVPSGQ